MPNPEIRLKKNGKLDEVVATNAYVHLEMMDTNKYWMAIESGGERVTLWITGNNLKITAEKA